MRFIYRQKKTQLAVSKLIYVLNHTLNQTSLKGLKLNFIYLVNNFKIE